LYIYFIIFTDNRNVHYTLKHAGLFQPTFGSNMDKPNVGLKM